MRKTTVLLCDDHSIVRKGLRFLLGVAEDMEVVAEAENGHVAVEEANKHRPDVVLMDIGMTVLNGIEATRRILQQVPTTKVLMLSCFSDVTHVQQALDAGAAGYLMKETGSNHLLQAIRDVRKGNAFFSAPIATVLLKQWRRNYLPAAPKESPNLTTAQAGLLQLIAEGYGSKQIACLLSVHVKTVGRYRQELMDKLQVQGIAALTRYAVFNGLVNVNPMIKWPLNPVPAMAEKSFGL
jgi:DNA-binding NarL/FixJ family response regulator